jgi:hypothetical protein
MLKFISTTALIVCFAMLAGCEEKGKEQDRTWVAVQEVRRELERVEGILRKATDKIDAMEVFVCWPIERALHVTSELTQTSNDNL